MMSIVRPTIVRTVLTRRQAQNNSRQVSTASILLARAIEFTSQTVHHRRGLLALAAGFFLGGGGLSGAALLSWNSSAAVPVEELVLREDAARKLPKDLELPPGQRTLLSFCDVAAALEVIGVANGFAKVTLA